ncbi:hypothetical protein MY04_2912 [Flammeovirga sp. MY04]|uniref:hypothetical protein n=1 Tax=Flammeovirga sp. MY04 TaxID=1191459 RepID=UPI0008060CAE|nr:hypothetical protein [Flammeovirga sp. MY04]ANQ50280.1 hypothetical protein MY04_2912 [Flammeovirga sp. MY04]
MISKFRYILFLSIVSFVMIAAQDTFGQGKKKKVKEDKNQHFRLFAEYDSFLVDLNLYFEKGVRYGTDSLYDDFESHWQNNVIDDTQKQWIYKSTKRLHKNRIDYRRQAAEYYKCIIAFLDSGQRLNPQFTRFLEIADTSLLAYSPKVTQNFFRKSHVFLKDGYLEKSKYTNIKVQGGNFTFEHRLSASGAIAEDMLVQVEEIPKEETPKEDWFGSDEENQETTEEETSDTNTEQSDGEYSWDDNDSSDSGEEYSWDDNDSSSDWSSDDSSWDSGDSSWDSDDASSSDWEDSWGGDDSNISDYGEDTNNADSYANGTDYVSDCPVDVIENRDFDPVIEDLAEEEGPMLKITEADLIITTKHDTLLLEKTVGTLLFQSDTLICRGGRVYWENVGFSKDSAWTELPYFSFDTRNAHIEADHAEMYFPSVLDTIAIGAFTYKSGHYNQSPEKAIYPQFISYNNIYKWNNLNDHIDFEGGFALKGRHVASKAISGSSSHLTYANDTSTVFTIASSKAWRFSDDYSNIRSKSGDLVVYYANGDSITHPSVNMSLSLNDSLENVYFRKTTDVYRFNPFQLSNQKVGVHADAITMNLQEDSLEFRITGGEKVVPLIVESDDFFQTGFFNRIQGFKKFHPLVMLVSYSRNHRKECFGISELLNGTGINEDLFRESLQAMSLEGLIQYNPYSDIVKLTDKAYRYYDRYYFAASERRRYHLTSRMNFDNLSMAQEEMLLDRDFDNIAIAGLFPDNQTANASLSMDDSTVLDVKKVPYFPISDSLNVYAEPDSNGVQINSNREIIFGGKFVAGTYIFRGRKFIFNYDSFLIKLSEVDSINFIVEDSASGKKIESPNPLVETGGTLFINKLFNKSGLLDISGYPSFNARSDSSKGGRIFYDRPTVLNGAYDRRIVFELDTFTVDASKIHSDVSFDGVFNSGGIFPTFRDEVTMDQQSGIFTLERETDADQPWSNPRGWPVYLNPKFLNSKDSTKGKGDFDGKITLNHRGIRGAGELHYLGSEFKSDDFIFYSDSLTTTGTAGVIESEVHPRVTMSTYDMTWYVNRDSMAFTGTHARPFTIYNDDIKFSGELALVPREVFGKGEIETTDSYNRSANIHFKKDIYISRHSKFLIHSGIDGEPSMLGNDVMVLRNIEKNIVDLRTEQNSNTKSVLTFPFVQFETSINKAKWNVADKNIVMNSENNMKGKFISTKPEQDSLLIKGDSAYYDLVDNKLNIINVDYIDISNIRVILDSANQTVHIKQNAEIENLENATMILGKYSELDDKHRIFNASVKLLSSKKLEGSGDYLYRNNLGEEKIIKIDRVVEKEYYSNTAQENTLEARAYGKISVDDPLMFLGGLEYYGKIGLTESKSAARFKDGNVRLAMGGDENKWFSYESRNDDINGEEDTIAHVIIDNTIKSSDENLPLITGLYFDNLNYAINNSFIERPDDYRADNIRKLFEIEGRLTFDSNDGTSQTGVYHIKPEYYYKGMEEDEVLAPFLGNFMSYSPEEKKVEFKGKFEFIAKDDKAKINVLKAGVDGSAYHGLSETTLNASFAIGGVKPSSNVSANMKNFLASNAENATKVIPEDYDIEGLGELNHQITSLFDPSQVKGYLQGKSITNLLSNYIVILDNEMEWSSDYASFYSTSDNMKVLSAFGEYINTNISGFIEIPKEENRDEGGEESDDVVNMFLEGPTGTWYYIRLQNEEMSIFSSNKEFNTFLEKQKGVTLSTPDQTSAFLDRFYANYRDGQMPPSRYTDELDKQMSPEIPEDDFGNDFGGVDDEGGNDDEEEGGSMDEIPVDDEEDDGDDF